MKTNRTGLFTLSALMMILSFDSKGAEALTNESMSSMPTIQPKKTFTVESKSQGEELQEQRGFGDQGQMVRMMNLMMVEGSGYEGMDMGEMVAANSKDGAQKNEAHNMEGMNHQETVNTNLTYTIELRTAQTKVGVNLVQFKITDSQSKKPAQKLKIKASVYMTSMDMGTETPTVKEINPGTYQVKAIFSMRGPWAIKLDGEKLQQEFKFDAK